MGKDRTDAEKKERKEKKLAETNGVSKSKSDKKEKKRSKNEDAVEGDTTMTGTDDTKQIIVGASVPFADPLVDEKTMKKVLKGVKRAAKHKALKRGVKEVVKSLRKSPTKLSSPPHAVVVLAADISPYDVISHIPVLCEDHNVPYVFVPSRAELGAAGSTKRPTSVVMVIPTSTKKAEEGKEDKDDKESWEETYSDLVKVAERAQRDKRIT